MPDGYSPVERPKTVDSRGISAMFGKPPDWFSRNRVRKALYPKGFPRPIFRGLWSRSAVDAWFEREGDK
jgi:hypothetical protein